MGTIDKTIRITAAIVVVALFFTNVISGLTAIILLAVAAIFLLTSFVGFCPLYRPFGISSKNQIKKTG